MQSPFPPTVTFLSKMLPRLIIVISDIVGFLVLNALTAFLQPGGIAGLLAGCFLSSPILPCQLVWLTVLSAPAQGKPRLGTLWLCVCSSRCSVVALLPLGSIREGDPHVPIFARAEKIVRVLMQSPEEMEAQSGCHPRLQIAFIFFKPVP